MTSLVPAPLLVQPTLTQPDNAALNQIENTAKEFEALVIAQLLQPLFASVETPGLAGGGPGQDAFETLLQEQYATAISERGGFGIADQVKAALIDLQSSNPLTRTPQE